MTRRYLLDTGPAQDFLFRRRDALIRIEAKRRLGAKVGICVPVLGEIHAGLELSETRDRNRATARRHLKELVCWPYDSLAAKEFGRIFAELRKIGRPIQQIDMQIAAIAKTLGDCTVVTGNGDFDSIDGLLIERWQH